MDIMNRIVALFLIPYTRGLFETLDQTTNSGRRKSTFATGIYTADPSRCARDLSDSSSARGQPRKSQPCPIKV